MLSHVVWNKIFSLSVLRKCTAEAKKAFIGVDTIFTYEAFSHAKRVGSLSGTRHKYYVMPNSWSSEFDLKRIESNELVFKHMLEYLKKRNMYLPEVIEGFYDTSYVLSIMNSLKVLVESGISAKKKVEGIRDIFAIPYTMEAFGYRSTIDRMLQIQEFAQKYTLSLPEALEGDCFELAADAFSYMPTISVYPNWGKSDIFRFFAAVHPKRAEKGLDNTFVNEIINAIISTNPILQQLGMSADMAVSMKNAVINLLNGDIEKALHELAELEGSL